MLSTATRLEDTVRGPRSHRDEGGEEDGIRTTLDTNYSVPLSNGFSNHEDEMIQSNKASAECSSLNGGEKHVSPKQLTPEETIELTRKAVENGLQETKRSLAGNEVVGDMMRPKLTIDLGHSHIARVPDAVVDLIKDEVERYDPFYVSVI
jgi:hypothetical protein